MSPPEPGPTAGRGTVREPGVGNPVPEGQVQTMFDRIAPIYERMNTLMTAGLDERWRRAAAAATGLRPGMSAVDVACGSGSLARRLADVVGATGSVLGVDVSDAMLAEARRRPLPPGLQYERGDALSLPVADASVDAATIAFGLRNVADYRGCLAEMARVTRPGGRIVVLEIATPTGGFGRWLSRTWFQRIVPVVGRLAGGGSAYGYLPASVRSYPPPAVIAEHLRAVGVAGVRWRRLGFGLVTLHAGRRT